MKTKNFIKKSLFLLVLLSSFYVYAGGQTSNAKKNKFPTIDLENSFYWAQCTAESQPEDVIEQKYNYDFKALTRMGGANLKDLVGPYGNYIWLKAEFSIPEEMKDENLGLYIQYLHFADKVWINGHYVGSEGSFPPHESTPLYKAHLYNFSKEFLKQNEPNTLLIKVWCHGDAEISKKVFIQSEDDIQFAYNKGRFYTSIIYMLFAGILFSSFIVYFIVFIAQRKRREYFSFAQSSFYSTLFSFVFLAPYFPFFQYFGSNLNYMHFYKIVICLSCYFIFYFFGSFIIYYLQKSQNMKLRHVRLGIVIVQVIITLIAPSYNALIKIFPYMLASSFAQLVFSFPYIVKFAREKKSLEQNVVLHLSLTLLFAGMIADLITRIICKNTAYTYFTYLGFLGLNLVFIIVLMIRFVSLSKNNEYLNENLQKEVKNQTEQIRSANILLADELKKSKTDMQMASIVQKKTFSIPKRNFVGWDFSIIYEPLEDVSGDMFDIYHMGNMLEGVSIFDVSGHGIAASLITFLAKNIIFQAFKGSRFTAKPMSLVLKEINTNVSRAKAGVDNYLTGIICHFTPAGMNGTTEVQFANAGHPHPFLYSAAEDKVIELKPEDKNANFGAIGLTGTDVNYVDIDFKMSIGDLLLFYTDGLTEAANKKGEQFGKARVAQVLQINHTKSAEEITAILKAEMLNFCGEAPRKDDLTLIALKRENPEDYLEAITDE